MKSFADVGVFGAFLGSLGHHVQHAAEQALAHGAELVAKDAQSRIGTYQDAVGPFAGWPELSDRTKAERSELGFSENDPLLRTGELRATIEHRAQGPSAAAGSDYDVALDQELGTHGRFPIPPRPFLGPAGFVQAPLIAADIAIAAADAVVGKPFAAALRKAGEG